MWRCMALCLGPDCPIHYASLLPTLQNSMAGIPPPSPWSPVDSTWTVSGGGYLVFQGIQWPANDVIAGGRDVLGRRVGKD